MTIEMIKRKAPLLQVWPDIKGASTIIFIQLLLRSLNSKYIEAGVALSDPWRRRAVEALLGLVKQGDFHYYDFNFDLEAVFIEAKRRLDPRLLSPGVTGLHLVASATAASDETITKSLLGRLWDWYQIHLPVTVLTPTQETILAFHAYNLYPHQEMVDRRLVTTAELCQVAEERAEARGSKIYG